MTHARVATVAALTVACTLALGTPLSSFAQTVGNAKLVSQIQAALKTSAFHAGELAQAEHTITGVHLHLHHVNNCLEGPNGPDFFAQAGDPCQAQGDGIIPDLKLAVTRSIPGASAALQEAQVSRALTLQALASQGIDESQPFALVVSRHLQAASQDLGSQ